MVRTKELLENLAKHILKIYDGNMKDEAKKLGRPGSRGPAKKKINTMIRVNLPPELHRKLWEMRINTRSSIQRIVTDILEEKFSNRKKNDSNDE